MNPVNGSNPLTAVLKMLVKRFFSKKEKQEKSYKGKTKLKSTGALRGILIPLGIIITHDLMSKNSIIRRLFSLFRSRKR